MPRASKNPASVSRRMNMSCALTEFLVSEGHTEPRTVDMVKALAALGRDHETLATSEVLHEHAGSAGTLFLGQMPNTITEKEVRALLYFVTGVEIAAARCQRVGAWFVELYTEEDIDRVLCLHHAVLFGKDVITIVDQDAAKSLMKFCEDVKYHHLRVAHARIPDRAMTPLVVERSTTQRRAAKPNATTTNVTAVLPTSPVATTTTPPKSPPGISLASSSSSIYESLLAAPPSPLPPFAPRSQPLPTCHHQHLSSLSAPPTYALAYPHAALVNAAPSVPFPFTGPWNAASIIGSFFG